MRTLTHCDSLWRVSIVSQTDGCTGTHSIWSDHKKAQEVARHVGGTVSQYAAWRDEDGNYYSSVSSYIAVDVPTRDEALSKLTPQEQYALGLRKEPKP